MIVNVSDVSSSFKRFITWRQPLGLKEDPFMVRWVINFYFFSIRLHHWMHSDDSRAYHDHPWWFWTYVIRGSYVDLSPDGADLVQAGQFRFRPASHAHTVMVPSESDISTWTIMLTGRHKRTWGFWITPLKWIKANKYFYSVGHHSPSDPDKRVKTHER